MALVLAEEAEMVSLPTELRTASVERRQWTEKVYRESIKGKNRLFGGREVSLEEFVHFTCLVSSVREGDDAMLLCPRPPLVWHVLYMYRGYQLPDAAVLCCYKYTFA